MFEDSKVVFITHPYYAVNNPTNNVRIYKKAKNSDNWRYIQCKSKEEYMSYDLSTNEYKITKESDWELFPLSYYYADGVEPEKFDPFKFMEQEMLDYNLQKSKNEEFVL